MMGVGFVIPFLPIFARDLGASGFELGLLFAGFSLSMGISQPLAGSYSDKYGRKKLLMIGLATFATCGFGYNLTDSVVDLTIVRLIQGLGAGMVFPVAMAYMADWAPKQYEGRYMGLFNVSMMAGIGSGPIAGGLLNDFFGIEASFIGMGCAATTSVILVAFFLPETSAYGKDKPNIPILQVFKSILLNPKMRGVLIMRMGMMFAMVPSFLFLPVIMSETLGASGTLIGIVITCRTLLSAFLQFPCGWLADRYNRSILTILSVVCASIVVSFFGYSTTLPQLMFVFILLGVFESLFMPTTSALAMESGQEFGMGSTMGVFNTALTLGMFIGSISAGFLVDQFGFGIAFLIIGSVVASFCLLSIPMLLNDKQMVRQSQ